LKKTHPTYLFFYVASLLVVYVSIFLDKSLLIWVKPLVPLSLIVSYHVLVKEFNLLFFLSMIVILVTDIFNYTDFIKYYDTIAILISTFYVLCVFLLKDYIKKEDVKLDALISLPAFLSVILIGYLVFSITELVMPKISNSLGSIVIIVVALLLFVFVSFFIYVANRYEKSVYLFIAACCTLFVDALLAINELYYYTRVFTVLINIAEIAGLYFFTLFLINIRKIKVRKVKDQYF